MDEESGPPPPEPTTSITVQAGETSTEDDNEDVVSPSAEGASTLTKEAASALEESKQKGNDCFHSHRYEEAIEHYSQALRMARGNTAAATDEAILLSNRSAAFSSLCNKYILRPAARSEAAALYGLDPTHLAQLALTDASKAVTLQPQWAKAYSRKAMALFLLERYPESREVYLQGLGLEPSNKALQEGLGKVEKMMQGAADDGAGAGKRRRVSGVDDFECTLCLKLLFEPATTPCGHTFCRGCFARAMDHTHRCPVCRTVLHIGRDLPVTITLASIIEKNFPAEYEERRQEEVELITAEAGTSGGGAAGGGGAEGAGPAGRRSTGGGVGADGTFSLPLFVMSTVLPGEKSALNIFEPRYRLLVRRAMEGNRRIGMAQVNRNRELEDILTEAEIVECRPQPDGRYYIEVVGKRRVQVVGAPQDLDGYRVARVKHLVDEVLAAGSPESEAQSQLANEVAQLSDGLVERLTSFASRSPRASHIREFLASAGARPAAALPELMSFWVATMLSQFLSTFDSGVRMRLLRMTVTRERLAWLKGQMQAFDTSPGQPCCIM